MPVGYGTVAKCLSCRMSATLRDQNCIASRHGTCQLPTESVPAAWCPLTLVREVLAIKLEHLHARDSRDQALASVADLCI